MNGHLKKVSVTVFAGLTLVLGACQQEVIDVKQARYQQLATESLKRMTARYSRSFTKQQSLSGKGVRASYDGWEGNTGGAPWGQGPYGGQVFQPRVDQAAHQCLEMIRSIPQTAATYQRAMVTVARCLNRIVQEKNYLLTWGYQQANAGMQNMMGYGNAFPLWQPFNNYGQQYQNQIHPWASNGYFPGPGGFPGNGGGFPPGGGGFTPIP